MLGLTRHLPAEWLAPLQLGLDRGRQQAADSLVKQNAAEVEQLQLALDHSVGSTPGLERKVDEFLSALREKSGHPFTSRPAMWIDRRVRGRARKHPEVSRLQTSLNHHFNQWSGNYDLWGEAVLGTVRGHAHAHIRHLSDDGLRLHLQRLAPQHTYVLQPATEWSRAPCRPRPDLVVMTPELHGRSPATTVHLLRECLREAPLGILIIDVLRAFPLIAAGALATTMLTPWPWQVLGSARYVRLSQTPAEWRLLARLAGAPYVQSGTLGPAFAWIHAFT